MKKRNILKSMNAIDILEVETQQECQPESGTVVNQGCSTGKSKYSVTGEEIHLE